MLKLNKEVNNYKLAYATQEIVDNIKKDKEQTLNQIKGTIYLT